MVNWKDIPTFPGYQVSDNGQVRSIERQQVIRNRWGHKTTRTLQGRTLSLQRDLNGYMSVQLGQLSRERVHRLVALAFVAGNTGLHVNHKNGDRADNRGCNLEWVTVSENHKHAHRHLPRKMHAAAKSVCVLFKSGASKVFETMSDAAQYLGVSVGAVSSALRHSHKCAGCEVRYV